MAKVTPGGPNDFLEPLVVEDAVEQSGNPLLSVQTAGEIDGPLLSVQTEGEIDGPLLSMPPRLSNRRRKATCLPTKNSCWDYPVFTRIAFPLLCFAMLPCLWYTQHHIIANIGVKAYLYVFPVYDGIVRSESVWRTVHDLWNMKDRQWALLVLTFAWSFCYPWVKYATCLLLWFGSGHCAGKRGTKFVNRVLAVVHWLGKWSYSDLYITMQLLGTLAGRAPIQPTPMFDVTFKVFGNTTWNLPLFVVIVAISIFLIWYLRWSRQKPELALKGSGYISLFTYTWEQKEWKMALVAFPLLGAMIWCWILSYQVNFAKHVVSCPSFQLDDAKLCNLWSLHNAMRSTKGLYWIFLVTVVLIPSALMLMSVWLWIVPLPAGIHSTARIVYSWMQMFSAVDVFIVTLIVSLESDKGLFQEILTQVPGHHFDGQLNQFQMSGGPTLAILYPTTSAVLLLWFRHYIGQQLRRRLETKPTNLFSVTIIGDIRMPESRTAETKSSAATVPAPAGRLMDSMDFDAETPGGPDTTPGTSWRTPGTTPGTTPGGPSPIAEKSSQPPRPSATLRYRRRLQLRSSRARRLRKEGSRPSGQPTETG